MRKKPHVSSLIIQSQTRCCFALRDSFSTDASPRRVSSTVRRRFVLHGVAALSGRIAATALFSMRAIATDVARSVVCLLVVNVSATKTDEPIEMPLWEKTHVGADNTGDVGN